MVCGQPEIELSVAPVYKHLLLQPVPVAFIAQQGACLHSELS